MDWSDLRIFLAIARQGTLGGAARRLGQTQPTMGRRLRALEADLGHALFQRTADGFVPTAEGTVLIPYAERMEEAALALERRLAGEGAEISGPLRVTAPDWFAVHLLAPAMARFAARHKMVALELLTDARLYDLARREADLAFRIRPFQGGDILARRLMHIPSAVYVGVDAGDPGDGAGFALITMDEAFRQNPDAA